MGSPYRASGTKEGEALERTEDGLVEELVRQFADPLAFYRELVQNGIDAGATRLVVSLSHDGAQDILHVSVRDDGSGMSRYVLEEQLTVLFRSGKDERDDAIGKFGVGFISVLAVEPSRVVVRTREAEGSELILHLHPDRTFDLFAGDGSGSAHGTTVTLEVAMTRAGVPAFVEGSRVALTRWCRHAQIPIQFVASVGSEPLAEARIDRPLGFPGALVEVRVEREGTLVVAALPPSQRGSLAFFNRGLLLHETVEGALGPVEVAIQDSRLEHTLSRDDVRKDEHHARAMRVARGVVDHDLAAAIRQRLRTAGAELPEILPAALGSGLVVRSHDILPPSFPGLTSAPGGIARRYYGAFVRDALVDAVAKEGAHVIDLSLAKAPDGYRLALGELLGQEIELVHTNLTLASPVELSGADHLLLESLGALLGSLARAPKLHLVSLAGALADETSVTGRSDGRLPGVFACEEARRDPFARFRRPPLWLNVGAPVVAAARRAAVREPALAAALLARVLLLSWRALAPADDDAWLVAAHAALLERRA